mmetsp:Transcript_12560/g.19897  ORF Transcript_12560/g.19897 Transcript_12560/m.19897 type:complete len:97 (-) Transcript_12560:3-293(-)
MPVGKALSVAKVLQAPHLEVGESTARSNAPHIHQAGHVVLAQQLEEVMRLVVGVPDAVDKRRGHLSNGGMELLRHLESNADPSLSSTTFINIPYLS